MADFQRVVEFLRDIRQGPLQSVTEEITQLAGDYAALCVQANERLRQCSTFLQQGLRSEAIHLADQAPNLLDLVALLDLPDQAAWMEFCQNNGLAVPPPLQLDRAAQLNEAYAQDQPMEHLLSRHRLLALSRAPVGQRLEVLRRIAQADAGNANWEKDIRILERARLKELPAEFHRGVRAHDAAAIIALKQEMTGETWLEQPPADLIAAVDDAFSRVQRIGVETDLRKLVEPLRDAYAARSLQECQALVQRWKNVMTAGNVAQVAPELMDEIRPVVAFVTEQTKRDEHVRRFREACKAFGMMLDQDEVDVRLEAGYARLKEFKEEIPEELTKRYAVKRSGRRQLSERAHKVRLAMIGATAVGVIIVSLVLAFLVTRSSAASSWALKIHNAVLEHTATGMANAQQYVDDLQKNNPGMLRQPQVAAAVGELHTEQSDFARDTAALEDILKRGAAARDAARPVVSNAQAATAEVAAVGATLQSVVNDATAAAGTLEWVDGQNQLAAVLTGLKGDLNVLKDRVSVAARGELENIATRLEAIPLAAGTTAAAVGMQAQIAALFDRVESMRLIPLLDEETRTKVSDLAQKIAQRRTGAESSRSVAEELQNIRQHAGNVAELKEALENFIRRLPDDPRSRDFAAAIQHMPAAGAIESWHQLVKAFNGNLAAGNLNAAQKRLDAVNAYLKANPGTPLATPLAQYADYLRRAIDALNDKGTWQVALGDLIATPVLSELGIMRISDGRQYYVMGNIKRIERRMNGQTSVSFETLNLKDLTERITVTVDPPMSVSDSPIPAPHTKVVAEIVDSLKLINENNWETYGIDLTDKLVRDDQIDLIVKAILVLQALNTEQAVAGDALEEAYSKPISELSRQTPDQLSWLDPTKITDGTRRAIKQALDGIPPAASVKQKINSAHSALFRSLLSGPAGSGVLLKDEMGAWQLHTRALPERGQMVWAVAPAGTASATPGGTASANQESMVLVGTVPANTFVLDEAALGSVPQGSFAYVTRP